MYNCGQASLITDKLSTHRGQGGNLGVAGQAQTWLESESCGVGVLGKLLCFSPSLSCLRGEVSPGPLLWVPWGLKRVKTGKTLLGCLFQSSVLAFLSLP